ncbi:TetR/AcrR family transcriptional regulator [Phyllobacterium meliloti]|uniref:TetR/AcrR family transcriptional regulator n=1 Tax=Phyllobacterium meliloti TaxID=555317 RepID=UPI001D15D038|nr:TetR/AcrR family transcriptional regulator [Phyllobacterium sp. T1293]UGX87030.1 TetR/AcrR family transcriptional regulator [Phyllobacterium sp. T1293]
MSKIDTRAVLIDEGLKALLSHGYEGAGIGPILKSAGVPKGSFYHFFASKEEFASAVVGSYTEGNQTVRTQLLTDESKSPLQRLRAYFEYHEQVYASENPIGGCLLGNLAQSIAVHSDVLRQELHRAFAAWQRDFQQVLREAREQGELPSHLDPDETAAFFIDAYEGALVRMKTEGSIAPLQRFKTMAFDGLLKNHA